MQKKDIDYEYVICAIHDVISWFDNFGYNEYGIACKDYFEDHEEINERLKRALKEIMNRGE